MAAETVRFKLSEPQSEIFAARSTIIADIAGQGAGKTVNIGLAVGWKVLTFPEAKGFVGANTYEQLSSSTLSRLFIELEQVYGLYEFDRKNRPTGHYVVGVKPPAHWTKAQYKFKSYNNIMSFWNGAIVFLGSLDNYKSHDGKEFAWAHLDETKDTKKEALTTVILGRLRQYGLWTDAQGAVLWAKMVTPEIAERQGLRAWNPCYIHTSPAEGNVDWLIDMLGIAPYEKEIKDCIMNPDDYFYKKIITENPETKKKTEKTVVIYSAYHNEHNLPPGFIENRKSNLSAGEQLKFIYGYPFAKSGGEYFPFFDRFKFVKKLEYNKALPIFTTWDFNATPYVTCLLCQIEYITRYWDPVAKKKYEEKGKGLEPMEVLRFRFFREYTVEDSTTESTADQVADDFEQYHPDIYVNGDASGRARIVGLGALTQYRIIQQRWENRFYLSSGYLRTKKINIQNMKRRDLLNRIWEGKHPEVEIEIDENCPNLIRDCEYLLKGKDGGKHKEKIADRNGIMIEQMGHPSDAMEYLVCEQCVDFIKDF